MSLIQLTYLATLVATPQVQSQLPILKTAHRTSTVVAVLLQINGPPLSPCHIQYNLILISQNESSWCSLNTLTRSFANKISSGKA